LRNNKYKTMKQDFIKYPIGIQNFEHMHLERWEVLQDQLRCILKAFYGVMNGVWMIGKLNKLSIIL